MSRHTAALLTDRLAIPAVPDGACSQEIDWKRSEKSDRHSTREKPECELAVVTTRSAFNALEADWCDLMERAGAGTHVFQSFHWLWHWCNHFITVNDADTTLAVVTGRRAGQLVLVWPLMIQRSGGLKRLTWMGHPVSQYGDALVDCAACDDDDIWASWSFLSKTIAADVIHLRKVRADAHVADVMQTVCTKPLEQQTAPYLDLSTAQSFDDYQKRYSGKARKNRRRLRRRVEEKANLEVKIHSAGTRRGDLASRAISMKRTWLQSRGLVSPAIQDERTRAFFLDAAASQDHPTGCRTTELTIGDETAAIEVSFVSAGHCAVHIIVYHMDYEKAGAGVLLMEDSIKSAIDSGVSTFDLMAPGDNYKLDWADGAIDVYDWCAPLSPVGQIYHSLGINKLPGAIKTVMQALPLPVRQLVNRGFAHIR